MRTVTTLNQLLELQIACRILLGAQHKVSSIHPLDYCYGALGVQMRPLERKSDEFKMLSEYAYRTMKASDYHIYNIFDLKRCVSASFSVENFFI
jgi:hypothetical protein